MAAEDGRGLRVLGFGAAGVVSCSLLAVGSAVRNRRLISILEQPRRTHSASHEPAAKDQSRGPAAVMLNSKLALSASFRTMVLSKEYVSYLARELTKKLIAGQFIETAQVPVVTERVHAAMLEELSLEDRINDEVRIILDTYADEMRRSGANYQEMFKKVKGELVRKYKAVL